jgi:hypothetical protein
MKAVQFVPVNLRKGKQGQDTFWTIPAVDEIVEYVEIDGKITDKRRNRKIQYVAGESSIYADEQREEAKPTPIIVQGNLLLVSHDQPNKLDYLKKCNFNVNNPMRRQDVNALVREYDVAKEYNKHIEKEDRILDAKIKAKEMDLSELKAYLMVLEENPGRIAHINRMTPEAIRHEAYRLAGESPKKFLADISDVGSKNKLILMTAIDGGYVRYSQEANSLTWDNGVEILRMPTGIKVIDVFIEKTKIESGFAEIMDMIKDKMRVTDDKSKLVKIAEPLDVYAQTVDNAVKKGIIEKKGAFYYYDDKKYQGFRKFREALKANKLKLFNTLLLELEEETSPPKEEE